MKKHIYFGAIGIVAVLVFIVGVLASADGVEARRGDGGPTATPTACDNPNCVTPTVTPTATPTACDNPNCVTPTVTPTASPTVCVGRNCPIPGYTPTSRR